MPISLATVLLGFALAGAPVDGAAAPAAPAPSAAAADSAPQAGAARMPEMEAAEALLRAGDFDAARKKLTEARKKNPRLAAAGVIVARWYLASNQVALARTELEQVITLEPDEPEPYAILGDLAWRDRRITETELLFRQALARADSLEGSADRKKEVEALAHSGLALVAIARKQWSAARDELVAWIELDEKNSIAHQRLGNALFHLGNHKDAFAEFQKAAKLDADFIPEIAGAKLYEDLGDHRNAIRLMSAAVKRLPGNVAVRLAVANWELESNRIAKAKLEVEAAMKTDPGSLDAKILAGGIARLQKDSPAAERFLEAAHLQSPTSFQASNLLALVLADQDDLAKQARALEFAQQNLDKYPQNSEAIATLGWALFRLGRWEDAERTLRQALATGRLNADGAYFVAKMFDRAGKSADAKTLLAKALATKRYFAYQEDAEQLLARLDAARGSAETSSPAAAGASPKAAE